jgi:hypothetical protein
LIFLDELDSIFSLSWELSQHFHCISRAQVSKFLKCSHRANSTHTT